MSSRLAPKLNPVVIRASHKWREKRSAGKIRDGGNGLERTQIEQLRANARGALANIRMRAARDVELSRGSVPLNFQVRVESLPRKLRDACWRTEAMHSFTRPLLLWFTRGHGRITIAGVSRGFGPHQAIFLPPRTMHGYDVAAPIQGNTVYFPNTPIPHLPEDPLHLHVRDFREQGDLSQQIAALKRELENVREGMDRAVEARAGLLAIWLDRAVKRGLTKELHSNALQRLASGYSDLVERDFRKGRSIRDYALDLGVTPIHLTRACKSACGRSASAILTDRVHYEARQLLAETGLSVGGIARELGFNSAASFSRSFHKQAGQTPTSFRQSSRQKESG